MDINSIIEKYNKKEEGDFEPEESTDKRVYCLFVKAIQGFKGDEFDKLLEKIQDKPKPLITIVNRRTDVNEKRINFFDSSIWFRMIEYNEDKEKQLKEILDEIDKIYEKGIYESAVAREFRDLQIKTALIKPLQGGAHAGKIAAFQFHSETEMKKKADDLYEGTIKYYEWSFLLIDDFAEKGLRKFEKSEEYGAIKKKEILESIINKAKDKKIDTALNIEKDKDGKTEESEENGEIKKNEIPESNINEKKVVKIDTALYIEKDKESKTEQSAIEKIKKNRYDIILLDYLFSNEDVFEKAEPEYGTRFFELIKDGTINSNKGIKEKYWIFPVSVFNSALLSDMVKKAYEYYTDSWYFSPGADPINTPHLFRYKLYRFLKLQIDYFPFNAFDLISVLLKYCDDLKSKEELKIYAYKSMPYFLEKYGFIFELAEYKEKSGFYKSITDRIKEIDEVLEFSVFELAETLRSFLNYAYNSAFQRNKLIESFIKLNQYKYKIKENCKLGEDEKNKLDKHFNTILDFIMEF